MGFAGTSCLHKPNANVLRKLFSDVIWLSRQHLLGIVRSEKKISWELNMYFRSFGTTELAKKVCPRLRDLATAPEGGITFFWPTLYMIFL